MSKGELILNFLNRKYGEILLVYSEIIRNFIRLDLKTSCMVLILSTLQDIKSLTVKCAVM